MGPFCVAISLGIISLIIIRVLYVIYRSSQPRRDMSPLQPLCTLIVMGSGGHTAEMLNLLSVLQEHRFKPRYYIAAATDNMSLPKAQVFENSLLDKYGLSQISTTRKVINQSQPGQFPMNSMLLHAVLYQEGVEKVGVAQFMQIYRSREVGQSYITSVGTTLLAMAHALWLMLKIRPQVILCNGPGTCIPLCAIAFLLKIFGIRWSYIFYVESIARVQRLSLSAFLLYKLRMADQLFVQWPQLKEKYPRAHYVGRLM